MVVQEGRTQRAFTGGGFSELLGRSRFFDTIPLAIAAYPNLAANRTQEGESIHPPKHETFDLVARTNTDPKGFVRAVDEYRLVPVGSLHGPADARPRPVPLSGVLAAARRWVCAPTSSTSTPAHERDQDYYLDVATITVGRRPLGDRGPLPGPGGPDRVRGTDLVDVDELLEAHQHGLVSTAVAESALANAPCRRLRGLAAHGHDLGAWLASPAWNCSWR